MSEKIYVVTLKKREDLEDFYSEMETNGFRLHLKRPTPHLSNFQQPLQTKFLHQPSDFISCPPLGKLVVYTEVVKYS